MACILFGTNVKPTRVGKKFLWSIQFNLGVFEKNFKIFLTNNTKGPEYASTRGLPENIQADKTFPPLSFSILFQ